MKVYLSFSDIKKLLRDTEIEFNQMNHESLYGMVEDGKAEVRAVEQQYKLMEQTIAVFRKIVGRKLKNLEEFKKSKN